MEWQNNRRSSNVEDQRGGGALVGGGIGLGEGADDLAPFDPEGFVDGLLGE